MAGTAAAVALLFVGLALLLHLLLPSDEQLAAELGARFEKASGIGLRVGAAHWSLRPSPVVVLEDLSTVQPQPIMVHRIVVRPRLAALWKRSIAIDSLSVEGALLPSASVRAFRGRLQAGDAAGAGRSAVAGPWPSCRWSACGCAT